MSERRYTWSADGASHELRLVWVPGTAGTPYLFGRGEVRRPIEVGGFYLGATPVTHALWRHVMGASTRPDADPRLPVDHVSWHRITQQGGFLDRINGGGILATVSDDERLRFRLPSESEWEYAARGGPHWRDDFRFSGSNDPDAVAWYGPRWGGRHELATRLLGSHAGWRFVNRVRRMMPRPPTRPRPVGTKAPNQLGIYDMSGNVWEWCQDVCVDGLDAVPKDGTPVTGPGGERRLRGGCHHNWDLHCTVSWRYGIEPDAADGCIGFRLVLAEA